VIAFEHIRERCPGTPVMLLKKISGSVRIASERVPQRLGVLGPTALPSSFQCEVDGLRRRGCDPVAAGSFGVSEAKADGHAVAADSPRIARDIELTITTSGLV
jgi:hypothetical protein